jgi:hypothetical protein
MNDTGDVPEKGEENVEPEMPAYPYLKKNT